MLKDSMMNGEGFIIGNGIIKKGIWKNNKKVTKLAENYRLSFESVLISLIKDLIS